VEQEENATIQKQILPDWQQSVKKWRKAIQCNATFNLARQA
jgi:hypothetical protein